MLGLYHPLHVSYGWDGAAVTLVEDTVEAWGNGNLFPFLANVGNGNWFPFLVLANVGTKNRFPLSEDFGDGNLVWDLVEACWPRLVFCLALGFFLNGNFFLVRELVEACWPRLLH